MSLSKRTIGFIAGSVAAVVVMGGSAAVIAHGKSGGWHGVDRHGMQGPMTMMKERMIERIDTDGDSAISRAEVTAFQTEHFTTIDADGDGQLTPKEMSEGMRLMIFSLIDENGDGQVSADEFMTLSDGHQMSGKRFFRLDEDGDGRVASDEVAMMVDHMFSRMDDDDNGMIDGNELSHGKGRHHD